MRILWRCPEDSKHTWEAPIDCRIRDNTGCPHPSHRAGLLAETHPELAAQWIEPVEEKHRQRTPYDTSTYSMIYVRWRCPRNPAHEWPARVAKRCQGRGCPQCGYCRSDPLDKTHPELAAQWIEPVEKRHSNRTPNNTSAKSGIRVRWRCPDDPTHEWEAYVYARTRGQGCPHPAHGAGLLAEVNPELAAQWIEPVEEKDRHRTPQDTSAGSEMLVFWRCPKDSAHIWKAQVNVRSRGNGCSHPSHRGTMLANASPELAAQWISPVAKNLQHRTPEDTSTGSAIRVRWRCPVISTHEWEAPVNARTNGAGCPVCGANGWNRATLAHFLSTTWEEFSTLEGEEDRREVFAAAPGALTTPSRQRSIIEAVIRNELTDEDTAAYIAGADTLKIQALLDNHDPHIYGGKDTISPELRARVYARDGYACLACGATTNLSCDHYPLPEIKGGLTEYESLRTLCLPCNCTSRTDALTIEEIRQRRGIA